MATRRSGRSARSSRVSRELVVSALSQSSNQVFAKETLIKGQPARIECLEIDGQVFTLSRGLLTTVSLEDEWFNEVRNPELVIERLKHDAPVNADMFTFCQRLPNVEPRFKYHRESECIAALRVASYEQWFKAIDSATRNKIRKSLKAGVEVRECAFDDEFVRGMTAVFNETPVRQGRRFWHYGKDAETVKQQFSRFLFREELIGAYYRDQLIGFVMLGKTAHFAELGQIISMVSHRDKAPTNALIAKAVEVCSKREIPYISYAFWTNDSLGEFKRQSGFSEVRLPRYFVPLTAMGHLALRTGAHHSIRSMLPANLISSLKRARNNWYAWRERQGGPRA
jgi:hypothetical protein